MAEATKRRILFVDDEPLVLSGLQRLLRGMRTEWEMYFVGSAHKALEILAQHRFDAVVTDMRMPEMDGAQLLDAVRQSHPHIVRIVLSGEMDPHMILKTVRNSHQYLNKPCEPDVLKLTLSRAFALRSLLTNETLTQLISGIEALPSLPNLYLEIIEALQSPHSTFKQIGDIIAKDIGMTAKILQMVNSAYFGLCRNIKSAQEAVSYLGMETVKSLVLSAKIFAQFDQRRMAFFPMDALWHHSLQAGLCAKAVAAAEGQPKEQMDGAFMAGVLHDLGKLVMAQNLSGSYREVLAVAQSTGRSLWTVELEIVGTTHAEIAAYLMGLWGMADAIVEAIAFHHRPAESHCENPVLTTVHAANVLARIPPGQGGEHSQAAIDATYLAQVQLESRIPVWQQACRNISLAGVEQ